MKSKILPHIFFVLILFASVQIKSKAQANVQDSLALVDLYKSTHGKNWNYSFNWLSTKPLSTWYGVHLNKSNRVHFLQLYENNLSGPLPASIGNLSELQQLYLNSNNITGNIPASLGKLASLRFLGLNENQLTGTIPDSLGNLTSVQSIVLSGNQLTGSIPASLANCKQLEELSLYSNMLSGSIPPAIFTLKHLSSLDLPNNNLSGEIPAAIGNCVSLVDLFLSNNQFTGVIPSGIGNLTALTYLALSNNQFTGPIPGNFANLANIWILLLDHNKLSGDIPDIFGNFKNLAEVYLNNNKFINNIPSSLGDCSSLTNLHLENNFLSGFIPASLTNLTSHVYDFQLQNNNLTFDAMEFIAQNFLNVVYSPQRKILLHANSQTLSVSAGGTLTNNTYVWHRIGDADNLNTVITGDSVFHPNLSGTYFVWVKNSVATALILKSNTASYSGTSVAVKTGKFENYQQNNKQHFIAYPNPAKDLLNVSVKDAAGFVLIDDRGKIVLTKIVAGNCRIDVSGLAQGVYYLKNIDSNEMQKIVISR